MRVLIGVCCGVLMVGLIAGGVVVVMLRPRPSADQQLRRAAANGDAVAVEQLLADGAAVNTSDDAGLGMAPLYVAACNGWVDCVEVLLTHGANTELRTKAGHTPLHMAVRHNHVDVARILILANADVNARDERGDTPLHTAAFHTAGKTA